MIRNHKSEFINHLESGENLLWTAQPKKGIVFNTADVFLIPFSLVWTGFSIFWVILMAEGSIMVAMFGMPFVLIGLMFLFGRFIIDARHRENTTYALTDTRIIIKSGVKRKDIKSIYLNTFSEIEYKEKNDRTGTIIIGPKYPVEIWGNGMNWMPGTKINLQLELIPEVKKIYSQIIEQQNNKNLYEQVI